MAYLKNTKVQIFLKTVRMQCRKCNVKLELTKCYECNGGDERCHGFFTEPSHYTGTHGVLRVATGQRRTADWLYTLAHEYAHFLQWQREDPIYKEKNYFILEEQTEAEAFEICKQFRLPIPRKYLRVEHKKYMRKLSRYGFHK